MRRPSAVFAVDALSAAENQTVGAIVGEFNATDPDGDAVIYSLVSGAGDTHNALFTLDQNGTLKVAGALDYETANTLSIRVQAKDELNATTEGNFAVTLSDVYEDTDGDGFRDSLEASTGSDLNDPIPRRSNKASSPGILSMAMLPICQVMETMEPSMGQPWEPTATEKLARHTVSMKILST